LTGQISLIFRWSSAFSPVLERVKITAGDEKCFEKGVSRCWVRRAGRAAFGGSQAFERRFPAKLIFFSAHLFSNKTHTFARYEKNACFTAAGRLRLVGWRL